MLAYLSCRLPIFAFILFSLSCVPVSAATLNVPSQYATIQAAVTASSSGDTILIADGTYTGPGNVDIDFGGKNITVTSQHGAASTIINCGGSSGVNHRGFFLHSGETGAVISGLTIQNGYEYGNGGGILNSSVGVTVQNCIVKNNTAVYGGGIYNISSASSITIVNCAIVGNTANTYGQGGGIGNMNEGNAITIANCTFTANTATSGTNGAAPGGGIYSSVASSANYPIGPITLTNDILYGDTGGEIAGSVVTVSYSDVQGGYSAGYRPTGDINADPTFVGAPSDLHLQAGSPCLGTGSASGAPTTTLDGQTRPAPPSIGAYETTPVSGVSVTTTTLTSSLNPSSGGQSVTFTANVAGHGGTPTGSVTFAVDGIAQTRSTLSNGYYATYSTSSLTAGPHQVTASYSGDATFAPSKSAALTQTVAVAGTTTSLFSSLNPATYGQQTTFTAAVSGSSPTGTVTFTDATSGTTLGTGTLTGGSATFSTSSLSAGSHQITASYGGDTNNAPSSAPALMQVVKTASAATTLTSSFNPSVAGQAVSFVATVTGSATPPSGSATPPSGTVTFTIDNIAQTPVPLNMGNRPSCTTSALSVGTHSVSAAYSGDANFLPSVSSVLTQVVNSHISPQYVSPSGNDNNLGTLAAPKLTIQAAINAAISGDTAIVEDGTYTGPGNVDIDFNGKNITVTSQHGATSTIIDCGGSASANHRGFYLHSGETSANINGLTIKNGYEFKDYGGGIYTSLSSGIVSVTNCTLDSNTASYNGGGIYNFNANNGTGTINVISCTVTNNRAGSSGSGAGGGGIYNLNSGSGTISVTNCTLANNLSGISGNRGDGGALFNINYSSNPISVSGCTITNNHAIYGGSGGGIYNSNNNEIGTINVSLCTVSDNAASDGGGIFNASNSNASGTINVASCAISGNTASDGNGGGGGVYNSSYNAGTTVIAGCTITNNTANYGGGGGIYNFNNSSTGTISVINCVVAGNTLTNGAGGGIANYNGYNYATGTISVTNCTIINNTAQTSDGGGGGIANSNANGNMSLITLANTILYGNTGGNYGYSGSNILVSYCDILGGYTGTGNIDADPLFVNASTDLHLQASSPCLGMGTASGALMTTIDGQTRPTPPSIGAYEILPAAAPGLLNDTDSGIVYSGASWGYYPGRGIGDFQNDVHAATSNGDSASYNFAGSSISVLAETNSDEGTVDVSIDGVYQQTINCASASRQVQQTVYSITGLAQGAHMLKLTKTGGGYLLLDALLATPASVSSSTINDTDFGIAYSGSSWAYYPGRGDGDFKDDVHAATTNGDSFSYTFTGTSVSYLTETDYDEGSVQVFLDGALQTVVSCYSPSRKTQQTLWSVGSLANASHTLKIVKQDGSYMLLDALQVSPALAAAPPTVVNDTAAAIAYSGAGWAYYPNRGDGDVGDDVHATTSNGDFVSYTFTGTSVSYVTETDPDEGNVQVYIDGVLKQTVSCSTPGRSSNRNLYSIAGLASGSHTIKLVKASGTYMLLDAFSFQ